MTDNAADTFPGWYPDPRGEADQRFWNGREWTSNTRIGVPAAQFIPAGSDGSGDVPAPAAPKRVEADASNGSPSTGSEPNAASLENAATSTTLSEPGRARIFGSSPSGDTATKVATKTEPPKTEPVAELQETAKKAPGSNSLFAKTQESSSGTSKATGSDTRHASGLDPESRELTERIDNDPLLQKAASRPAVAPLPAQPATPASGMMGKLLGSGLVLLLLGGLIGWAIGRGNDDNPVASNEEASVAATDESNASSDETVDDTDTLAMADTDADEATAELQTTVDDLTSELEETGAQVDAITAERDNALEHNEILQTWFTPEVRANSERAWDLGVQQACNAEADPTIENTSYTRAMELIGTHADLVTAALVCRSEG